MVIDLVSIINSIGFKKDFEGVLSLDECELGGETYSFPEPIKLSGSIMNNGGIFDLTASVSGYINLKCYRCTVGITKAFEFLIDEKLSNNEDAVQDGDIFRFKGNILDLKDIVINNIFINLSMKYLCSDECKGLCPVCGIDLNNEECDCASKEIDIRFEKLRNLFNKP